MQCDRERQKYALLLTGGGARAAYQVGVMKAITTFLPRNHSIPFPIICGTSAGAINATGVACYASCYHLGIRKLEWVWKNFKTEQVYQCDVKQTFGYMARNYLTSFLTEDMQKNATSLLNNAPLRQLIRKVIDFHRIDRNLLSDHLRAVSVSVSSYSNHDAISYFQSKGDISPWQRESRQGKPCILNSEHLMASSAIPLVFPSVKIDGQFLGDGAIHQISPLSTPIRLGAERILIIGVDSAERQKGIQVDKGMPSNATIAGHLLDTLFADTLSSDLERLTRINDTLKLLNEEQRRQTELKPISYLHIRPSRDFQDIASRHYHRLPPGIKTLLRITGVSPKSDSSLLSYLLFEKEFCQELIKMGYEDGLARQDEICDFLNIRR